jgi:hypothetical protein
VCMCAVAAPPQLPPAACHQVPYLTFLGFPVPQGESTADFLLDVVSGGGGGGEGGREGGWARQVVW